MTTHSPFSNLLILCFFSILIIIACGSPKASYHEFAKPVDTTDKPINMQEKKVYAFADEGIYFDNQFAGARLNGVTKNGDNTFKATISPENTPINHSAYYAFRVWSNAVESITLELDYTAHFHRYPPKISTNGKDWKFLDSSKVELAPDSINAFLTLNLSTDTLWVSAQELLDTEAARQWCTEKAKHADVNFEIIGKSKLGRDLFFLDIRHGESKKKEIIAVMSRQHPPEVTGYLAFQAFIDEILSDTPLSKAFRAKYRILVFPHMNPDGVDLGHWRHNAGGIDLNRDWAYYHQPETRQVANFIVKESKINRSKVILGLDFHSTWNDVYYTNSSQPDHISGFKDYWLHGIENAIPGGFEAREVTSKTISPSPVSKGWFYKQFKAESITYEIGDNTPRDFIQVKGSVSAIEMMQLLVFRD